MKNRRQAKSSGEWKVDVARDFEGIEAIRPVWERMQLDEIHPTPNADIDDYLCVVRSMKDSAQPYVMIIRRDGDPKAMVIGRIERHSIPCSVGYTSILSIPLRCLTIAHGGILGRPDTETCSVLIEELRRVLGRRQADVVFFNHLQVDSEIYNLVRSETFLLCRDRFPVQHLHWKSSLPNSYEEFYGSLSKNTRHNIRRYQGRLAKKYGDRLSVRCFTDAGQIDQLFEDTMEVARKTYQHGLGSTFLDDECSRNRVRLFVDRELLAAYVLYIDGIPRAFWNGVRYGKTFFTWTTGYDPAFQNDRLGLILLVKVVEALCEDQNVDAVDFGFGDAQYKRSLSDTSWVEATTYIFASRLYPTLVNTLRNSAVAVDSGLKYVLNRFGAINWIKQRWRNALRTRGSKTHTD